MTPEEVSALSEKQLNAACAQYIMGWRVGEDGYTHADGDWTWRDDWNPATYLLDSAMCTDKERADGWYFAIHLYPDKCMILGYRNMHRSISEFQVEHARRDRAEAEAALVASGKEKA